MSQSRMREIECVLDPAGAAVSDMSDIGMMGFGNVSGSRDWVDMLVGSFLTLSRTLFKAVFRSIIGQRVHKKYCCLKSTPRSM